MEMKNIDCNILDVMGDKWDRSGSMGPFEIDIVYRAFSDIPEGNVNSAIQSLVQKSLLRMHADGQRLYLTRTGVAEIESIRRCLMDYVDRKPQPVSGCCA